MNIFKRGPESRFNPAAIVGMVLGGIALALVFAFVFGWIVMLLWNWLMPDLFGLKAIGFWQAWGLVLLSHILIKGGFGHHGRHGHGRGRCGRDGDEWRERMRERFGRGGPDGRPGNGPDAWGGERPAGAGPESRSAGSGS